MSPQRESVGRTLLVAGAVALVCSLMVSTAVIWLRPIQAAYQSIDRNAAIVAAAGLIPPGEPVSDRELVGLFLSFERRIADLSAGTFADEALAATDYGDYREAMVDPQRTEPIDPAEDAARIGRRPTMMPVYVLAEESSLRSIVLPVYGRGMWSTIHGFVGLGPDLATIVGVSFYDHGETPGIGDRIQSEAWLASWRGKRAFDDEGVLVLRVGGSAMNAAAMERIDAITGATVTVTAVDGLIRYWLGDDGYGPLLRTLRGEMD